LTLDGRTGKGNGCPCDLKMKSELEKMAEGLRHEAEIYEKGAKLGWIFGVICGAHAIGSSEVTVDEFEAAKETREQAHFLEVSAERWDDGC